jgi:predicted deacylase
MSQDSWEIFETILEPSQKIALAPEANVSNYQLPVTLINGREKGKTVLITAGLHADEYVSMVAAIKVAQQIDPSQITGRIIIFPCVNVSGFWNRSRRVEECKTDLNRNFPGDPNGSVGDRIADFFVTKIFPEADFVLDLHGGSIMEPLTPCLFFPATAGEEVLKVSKAAALSTDIPYLLASSATSGLYSYAANTLKKPGLLLERGHSGLCPMNLVSDYIHDIYLLLKHLNVYPYEQERSRKLQTIFHEIIYLDTEILGLWYPNMTEGTIVKKGDLLGHLENFYGDSIAEYRAKGDALIFYYTGSLSVKEGDFLVAYGLLESSEEYRHD